MKLYVSTLILLIFNCSSYAQSWGDSTIKKQLVFSSVEQAPAFPGGTKGLYKYMSQNLHEPEMKYSIFSNKLAIVKFVIDQEGSVVFAEIEKGINDDYNQSVLEMVRKMPAWKPGKQNNRPVKCYVTLPVVFVNGE